MFQQIYQNWKEDPSAFWGEQAHRVDWVEAPKTIFDDSTGLDRWYPDGVLNTCFNCVDRHVNAGRADQAAFIYDSPVTTQKVRISYGELLDRVQLVAGMMADHGVGHGDRVIIYMPMIPETAIAALACARLGAVHSIVFGGFAPAELATRIDDAQPKLILSASCGIEPSRVVAYKPLLDGAIELAQHKPDACIIFQRDVEQASMIEGRDHDWMALEADARDRNLRPDCVPVKATDPLYILYTSGTTGIPKGVVRDNGGHMVALTWAIENVYDIHPGEVFWSASDMGWVVGHSFILYGPLAIGATSIIYEGKPVGTPDAGAFWRVISEHRVKALFTAPTAFRAIKKEDPEGELVKQYDLTHFKALFLAGERVDPDTIDWAEGNLKVPVIDNWWQTETGWPICSNPLGVELLPVKKGSPTLPMPGYDVRILGEAQDEKAAGEFGTIVVKLPLPPGCLPTLWHNDEGFRNSYLTEFPGYYNTGDAGYLDEDGYLFVMSRTDDIINVAGHRLSTGGMEEILSGHHDVAECAVLGVRDALKGELPLGLVVLNDGVDRPTEEVLQECIQLVRAEMGPVAAFKLVAAVKRLPKTRSGKILRGTIRSIANGDSWKMPATIDDPTVLDEMESALQDMGYAQNHAA
ncbi:MAG: propionyl-CoA synthetase [Xanthomonadales bacterium]|nr:propionyl-CoA synthetase [Xanthomonadales bacterium]